MPKQDIKFYCVKGKHSVKTKEYKIETMKNKRKAYVGKCPDHGTKLYRIAGKELDQEI